MESSCDRSVFLPQQETSLEAWTLSMDGRVETYIEAVNSAMVWPPLARSCFLNKTDLYTMIC